MLHPIHLFFQYHDFPHMELQRNNDCDDLCPQIFHQFANIHHVAECRNYHHDIKCIGRKTGLRLDGINIVARLVEIHSPAFLSVHITQIKIRKSKVNDAKSSANVEATDQLKIFDEFQREIQAFYSKNFRLVTNTRAGFKCILKTDGPNGAEFSRCMILEVL